jgi:cytochrome c-type biogenesis protein CcmH/NrfG
MERLQGDVRALLEQAAKNEANLTAMRERMEKAESERVPMGVVYGLVALIVACLAGLAYLWTRRPKVPVWEQGAPPAPLQPPRTTVAELSPEHDDGTPSQPAAARKPLPPEPDMDVDVNLVDMDEESFSKLMDVKPDSGKPSSGKVGA